MKTTFNAPWGTTLKWTSSLVTIVVLAVSLGIPAPEEIGYFWWPIRLFGPVLIIGTALYTVRGYEIHDGTLYVQRLLWKTPVPLRGLKAVEYRPGNFGWAWRTFGNGGLFSFSGWYFQTGLGSFRALATQLTNAVILQFNDRKPIVVTPETPETFAQSIREAAMKLKPTINSEPAQDG